MRLKDVGMVLSPTPRSSAYLQALVRRRLFPSHVIVFETDSGQLLPGQLPPAAKDRLRSLRWLESSYFDPGVTVAQLIHENNLSYECLDHGINTVEVEAIIHRRPERIFVYSGTDQHD